MPVLDPDLYNQSPDELKGPTMFNKAKCILIAALLVTAAIATPSNASARILFDRQAPAVYTQETATTAVQVAGLQASSDGFDWGAAGIGAAATVVLLGAGTGMVIVRRRQGHRAAIG